MPSLADVLPRVDKPDRRERHEVALLTDIVRLTDEPMWICTAADCWFESYDMNEVARHVVENQWQSS